MTVGEFISVIGTQTDFKLMAYTFDHKSFQVGGTDTIVCGKNTNHINTDLMDNEMLFCNVKGNELEIFIKAKCNE